MIYYQNGISILRRLAFLLLFVSSNVIGNGQELKKDEKGYLEIFCPQGADKVIPKIIFYVKGTYDSSKLEAAYLFEISRKEFRQLKDLIFHNDLLHNGKNEKYADFIIIQENKRTPFFSKNKSSTSRVFKDILKLFTKHKARQKIERIFKQTEDRLI